ncbi:hypothetical protein COEREDRAFT_9631 [Coemansia reversa NRRL 1564]|uniref:Transmembrane protein n=1 Tax=Coemansia reversa (strain ATCC 12441 / NRRL 1564) TaxID=763665 RepID=A0A2G5B8D4_COERN|nr:hypothetical protein COEREDRAFT_9631 [Coemansia reversa NRRL 1564]|eukprot:PIA15250.1 hypothetical protein COEREDRAFT_9631 [Coemansia reversa NRRL 1564]
MSFEFTPDEQARVEIAEFLGVHLDPIGYVDLSTIIVLGTMYAVEFIALCYQLYNRDYPPLKAKNVPVMFSLYFGGVAWFCGDVFTSGLVHLRHNSVLQSCRFTAVCLRVCAGAFYVSSGFALRCYSLYHVFYKGKAYRGKTALLTFGLPILTIVIFGVISLLVPETMTLRYEEIMDLCYFNKGYVCIVLSVIWIIWAYTAYMSWKMRKIPFCFNEKIEITTSYVILFIVVIMNTVCILVIPVYAASLGWRTALLYTNHVGASVGYWIIMFECTYNCIFHREDYLQYWINILKEDHMEREYEYSSHLNNNTTLVGMSTFSELPYKTNSHYQTSHRHDTASSNVGTTDSLRDGGSQISISL